MIVVDTSAIMAILLNEPDAANFRQALALSDEVRMSAMTDYESRLLAFKRGQKRLLSGYELLLGVGDFSIDPFARPQAILAFEAHCRFGKGNHPAGLNLAECAAYAPARELDAPLLFKGNDFARTDVRRAL